MVLEVGKQPWLLFSMDMEGIKIGDIYPNNRVHSSVYLKYKVFLLVLRNYLFLWKFSFKKDIFSMRQRLRVVEEKLIGQWARGDSPKTLSFEIFFFSFIQMRKNKEKWKCDSSKHRFCLKMTHFCLYGVYDIFTLLGKLLFLEYPGLRWGNTVFWLDGEWITQIDSKINHKVNK